MNTPRSKLDRLMFADLRASKRDLVNSPIGKMIAEKIARWEREPQPREPQPREPESEHRDLLAGFSNTLAVRVKS